MPVWLFEVGLTVLLVVALCMSPVGRRMVLHLTLTARSLRLRVVGVPRPILSSVCSEVVFCTLSSAVDCGADLPFTPFLSHAKMASPPPITVSDGARQNVGLQLVI